MGLNSPIFYWTGQTANAHRMNMLDIEKVDHVGIRVSNKAQSVSFYEILGFKFLSDSGFDQGHPIIMQHASGVVLNLLGPTNTENSTNILMDVDEKHSGITHVSYKVRSLDEAKAFLAKNNIPLTGEFSFKDLQAVFIRDPDRNVIELDAYVGDEPETRGAEPSGYNHHP
jgi:lactoylglutathione lyase